MVLGGLLVNGEVDHELGIIWADRAADSIVFVYPDVRDLHARCVLQSVQKIVDAVRAEN